MTHRVELREAQFEDYEGISALERAHGLATKPFDEWRQMWTANPCYHHLQTHWPIGWILTDHNRVVGCLSNIPLPYVFQERELLVATGRGWAVEDEYRSYSLLLMDEYFNQESADLFLTNTVNDKSAAAFATFRSLPAPVGDWATAAFIVTRHRGFAESALFIKGMRNNRLLSYPLGLALFVKDCLTGSRLPKVDIKVSCVNRFDNRFDVFWDRLRERTGKLMAVRSQKVLEWHFGPAMERKDVWTLTVGSNGAIEAYGIFQRRDEPQYGLKRLRMVDFQALENHDQYCAAIIGRASDECRRQGIHALEQVGCNLESTRVFEAAAPYRRKLSAWCFYYAARDSFLAARLARPEVWAPSAYDGDSSL